MQPHSAPNAHSRRFGFTLPEVLVVMAVIALLIGILLPALSGALRTSQMASSQNKLKQIGILMRQYSTENREYIVPSQFDYTQSVAQGYPVKIRSYGGLGPLQYQGTWTDILWTFNGMGVGSALDSTGKYDYDSPDRAVYDADPTYDANIFRAAAVNSRDFHPGAGGDDGVPKPFGNGAHESAIPGFFAANDFFNSRPDAPASTSPTPGGAPVPTPTAGRWYVTGQIKSPDKSMYAVDSVAGEVIAPVGGGAGTPWFNPAAGSPDLEADFRYNGSCLMLFLDGHSAPEGRWNDLTDLEGQVTVGGAVTKGRDIRISQLTRSGLPWVP